MKSNRVCSDLPTALGMHAWRGLSFALALAVALPEEVPAATMANTASMGPAVARAASPASDLQLVHYYCGYASGVVAPRYGYYGGVGYYGGYYGVAGVRGGARRVARRTGRRVARRR
jgi:hypothetical protein